jgi:FtsP/CotA-like multicopper oxidase with cupredoxin domain
VGSRDRGVTVRRGVLFALAFVAVVVATAGPAGMRGGAAAGVTVHPFQVLPTLPARGAKRVTLLAKTSTTCTPSGSVSYDGNNVNVALDLVRADFTINNPDPSDPYGGEDPVTLRSYGGCKAGPQIDVNPGNTLRVQLHNALPADDPSCLASPPAGLSLDQAPGVGCFNTTNLHTHGLHVSPVGNSDNVLLALGPQTRFSYEINSPSDHPAGTFWYHAHMHGATALQVASGTAGVLIVRGHRPYRAPTAADPHPVADVDTILHDAHGVAFPDTTFLFEQIAYACFANDPKLPGGPWQQIFTTAGLYTINSTPPPGTPPPGAPPPIYPGNAPWTCPTPSATNFASRGVVENFPLQLDSPQIWDTNGRFTSINGVVQPTITVPAGQIMRWRTVHAGIHDTINLQIVRSLQRSKTANAIALSALSGNRRAQRLDVGALCPATPTTFVPQFEIAEDGLTRTKINAIDDFATTSDTVKPATPRANFLQPGYRSDILVVFPEDGADYCLLDQAAPASERVINGGGGGQGPSTAQLLAYVHVRGGHAVQGSLGTYVTQTLVAANPQLPAAVRAKLGQGDLTPWAPFVELAAPQSMRAPPQKAHFAITGDPKNPNGPPLFLINAKAYDPNVVNIRRQVGTTDDWLLSADGEPHIFHIHVNPFEIVDVTHTVNGVETSIYDANGNCKPSVYTDKQGLADQYCGMRHVFRDTVFVENGYRVHARTHYSRYIGEFVIHCHILDHEDAGMMLNIEIVPDLAAPNFGLGMPRAHPHR